MSRLPYLKFDPHHPRIGTRNGNFHVTIFPYQSKPHRLIYREPKSFVDIAVHASTSPCGLRSARTELHPLILSVAQRRRRASAQDDDTSHLGSLYKALYYAYRRGPIAMSTFHIGVYIVLITVGWHRPQPLYSSLLLLSHSLSCHTV